MAGNYYSKPEGPKLRNRGVTIAAGSVIDIPITENPSEAFARGLTHEVTHGLLQYLLVIDKKQGYFTKLGLIVGDKNIGIDNGLALWNACLIDLNTLQGLFRKSNPVAAQLLDVNERRLSQPPYERMRYEPTNEDIELFGVLHPRLIRGLIQPNGMLRRTEFMNLRITQELARLIGYQASLQLPLDSKKYNYIQLGKDIMERDQLCATDTSQELIETIFKDDTDIISRISDDVSEKNLKNQEYMITAMKLIRKKEKALKLVS